MFLLHARHHLYDPRRHLRSNSVDHPRRDDLPRIETRTVVAPLPELYPRDLGGSRVLHEVVERDAAVARDPASSVGERGGDVGAHAVGGDGALDVGVEKVVGGDVELGAQDVVLQGYGELLDKMRNE